MLGAGCGGVPVQVAFSMKMTHDKFCKAQKEEGSQGAGRGGGRGWQSHWLPTACTSSAPLSQHVSLSEFVFILAATLGGQHTRAKQQRWLSNSCLCSRRVVPPLLYNACVSCQASGRTFVLVAAV